MRDSIRRRLERLTERHEEVGRLLADPSLQGRSDRFRELSMEYARIEPLTIGFQAFLTLEQDQRSVAAMASDADPEIRSMADDEQRALATRIALAEAELQRLLIPKDVHDEGNIYLEIRAGAGGDEAAIFAGDLFRMYSRYADNIGWRVEIVSENRGEHGGYREVISRIVGQGVYSKLKFESGTHRVQRVPATEAQGRIHTSTCTVAILPDLAEIEDIPISDADLKVDTYRASGAGGQHVNKTDSAIRITHLPTGSWSSVRKNAPSTRIAPAPCRCLKRACCRRSGKSRPTNRPPPASCRSVAGIAQSAFVPTTFRKAA